MDAEVRLITPSAWFLALTRSIFFSLDYLIFQVLRYMPLKNPEFQIKICNVFVAITKKVLLKVLQKILKTDFRLWSYKTETILKVLQLIQN